MDKGLRLVLLGKPQISRDGAPVTGFIYNKALALLGYLAVTGRPHSRDALAGLLWGEMPDAAAKANLRKILAALREVAGHELIIDRQTVVFDTESLYWLDTEVFESKLQSLTATSLTPANLTDRDMKLLDEAVQLYGGDFLEGFYVRDAPAFEEWVLPERERLRQKMQQALHRLAVYYTAREQYVRAIAYTSRLLALEPWHEEVHQQMMLLLALSGQRSAALTQYETCRRLLADEFGARPNADTVALYKKINAGEAIVQPQLASQLVNWPIRMTAFVGRADELAAIHARLANADCRMVTLVGLSGSGKSRLAIQAAAATMQTFRHGVCFVAMAPVVSHDLFYPALAEALNLPAEHQRDSRTRVQHYLLEREMLLVLDRFEHLQECATPIQELLQHAPGVKLLVTALERLGLEGEWVLPVYGLTLPPTDLPHEITSSDAGALFLHCARRARADFAPPEIEWPAIAHICQLVEGVPLGIELAAAWTRALTCREIAQEIENSSSFLTDTAHDRPERHRSLNAALDQSWHRLSEAERGVLRRLCVFRGGFTREAAEQVAGVSLLLLASLMDKCLVQSTPFGRYSIHQWVMQYGLAKLAETPNEQTATYDRYARYYTATLRQTMKRFDGMWEEDALAAIAVEKQNLRHAWAWTAAQIRPGMIQTGGNDAPQGAENSLPGDHVTDERLSNRSTTRTDFVQKQTGQPVLRNASPNAPPTVSGHS